VRQGNQNSHVHIYRYVTEATFDSYLYQIVESKQRFIDQIMTSKSPVRSASDIDGQALSYAEIKALATGDTRIKEKMDLDIRMARLKVLKGSYFTQKYALEDKLRRSFPLLLKRQQQFVSALKDDLALFEKNALAAKTETFSMILSGRRYTEPKAAGEALLTAIAGGFLDEQSIGDFCGFSLSLRFDTFSKQVSAVLSGSTGHEVALSDDARGNITRLSNVLERLSVKLSEEEEKEQNLRKQISDAEVEVKKPFEKAAEYAEVEARLTELTKALSISESESEGADADFSAEGQEEAEGEEREEAGEVIEEEPLSVRESPSPLLSGLVLDGAVDVRAQAGAVVHAYAEDVSAEM
jgi:hypothetical protein